MGCHHFSELGEDEVLTKAIGRQVWDLYSAFRPGQTGRRRKGVRGRVLVVVLDLEQRQKQAILYPETSVSHDSFAQITTVRHNSEHSKPRKPSSRGSAALLHCLGLQWCEAGLRFRRPTSRQHSFQTKRASGGEFPLGGHWAPTGEHQNCGKLQEVCVLGGL